MSRQNSEAAAAAAIASANVSEQYELRVIHALRLKSIAEVPDVAAHAGLEHADAEATLMRLAAHGFVRYREGSLTGWSLLPEGRTHGEALLEAELERTGKRAELESLYDRFLELNRPFLALCTNWQVRDVHGEQVRNDHDDADYDASVVDRLVETDARIQPICDGLKDVAGRFDHYGPGFSQALARLQSGDKDWFTSPLVRLVPHGVARAARGSSCLSRHRPLKGKSTMSSARFGRVLSAMVTPFDDEENLDLDAAAALASWLVQEQKHEGLVLAGTTGEAPTLTHDEQGELFRAVRAAVDVPIVAGAGSNDTVAAIDLATRAVAAGVDGLLVVTPYYNRPSQAALIDHFTAIAKAAEGLPVIIYDIPKRTGRKVESDTLLTLAHDVENIIGLKDAAGNPGRDRHAAQPGPRRVRGLQRRRRVDPAAHGDRCRRRHRCGDPLDRGRARRDVRRIRAGRRGSCP